MTLLLRSATGRDVHTIRLLLSDRPLRPGERVVVLVDIGALDDGGLRAAAVVRESERRWFVVAAQVDSRWPPAAVALVDQLRSTAIAGGAGALVFRPCCASEVLAEAMREATVDVGGAVTVAL